MTQNFIWTRDKSKGFVFFKNMVLSHLMEK